MSLPRLRYGNYYGIKKTARRRKEHSLRTTDRKVEERKLKAMDRGLGKNRYSLGATDSGVLAAATTLVAMIPAFVSRRQRPFCRPEGPHPAMSAKSRYKPLDGVVLSILFRLLSPQP